MSRCYLCGDDGPFDHVHHGHNDDEDCGDLCHTVCANCDAGLCVACGEDDDWDKPSTTRATKREHVAEGYYVTIQHCDHKDGDVFCNKYLGVNYPSERCDDHERKTA